MFTISQVKEAHSKVKSGADFPRFIQDLIKLGVKSYDTFVLDGHSEYVGADNYEIKSEGKYSLLTIANTCNVEKFKHCLKIHQQGETDYLAFCNHSAECGVEKWKVDTIEMTCVYYDISGNKMVIEIIPS